MEFEDILAELDTTPEADANTADTGAEETESTPAEATETTEEATVDEKTEPGANTDTSEGEPPFELGIRFNHQDIVLNREDAVKYSQLGKLYEAGEERRNKLDYLATVHGKKDADELIESLIASSDELKRRELQERYGDDADEVVEMMMKQYHEDNNLKVSKAKETRSAAEALAEEAAKKTVEGKIAEGFLALQKEFPNIREVKDVPVSVLKEAKNGRDMVSAYLLYQHQEQKKASAAKQTATAAAASSTGSASASAEEGDDAFLKGLFG